MEKHLNILDAREIKLTDKICKQNLHIEDFVFKLFITKIWQCS